MRSLNAIIEAAKDATEKCFVLLLEIDTASGTLYYANLMDDIAFPYGGQNYVSKSFILDEVTHDGGLSFPEAMLSVANLDQALSYASLTRSLRGRDVRVKLVFIDISTGRTIGTADDYIDLVDGIVEDVELIEIAAQLIILPALAFLDRLNPVETYGPSCPWVLGDVVCGAFFYDVSNRTVDAGSTTTVIQDAWLTQATDFWKNGYIELTSGDYVGEKRRIVSNVTGSVTLEFPFPGAPDAGTTYRIRQGCDKTYDTCRDLFSNETEFGGFINYDKGLVRGN